MELDPPIPLIEFALLSSTDNKTRTHKDILPVGVEYSEKIELANIGEIEISINDNSIEELDKYKVILSDSAILRVARFHPGGPV